MTSESLVGHRVCFTTGVRAVRGYLQADGTLTSHSKGGRTVVADASAFTLHHVALDCAECGTTTR